MRSVYPPHGQWPAPVGSWRVCLFLKRGFGWCFWSQFDLNWTLSVSRSYFVSTIRPLQVISLFLIKMLVGFGPNFQKKQTKFWFFSYFNWLFWRDNRYSIQFAFFFLVVWYVFGGQVYEKQRYNLERPNLYNPNRDYLDYTSSVSLSHFARGINVKYGHRLIMRRRHTGI